MHDLRIATRRLISQLALCESIVPTVRFLKARRILKRRFRALGELRDVQVQRAFLSRNARRFPQLRPVRELLAQRECRIANSAARKIRGLKTKKLKKWIAREIADLVAETGDSHAQIQQASAILRRTTDAFVEVLKRWHAIKPKDLRTIHRTRVAFKKFRYMVESLPVAVTGLSQRERQALAEYQRKMGRIQDLEVIEGAIAALIQGDRKTGGLLPPFRRHLQARRAHAVALFLKSADEVFAFWPPRRLSNAGNSA